MIISSGALSKKKVMQAFPLMREIDPGLELGVWINYAGRLTKADGGLHGVFGAERDGYVRGVFCYEVSPDTSGAATLHIRNFVVLDMVQREAMADILYRAIGDIARGNGCRLVRVHLPRKSFWAAQRLEAAGYIVQPCDFACGKSSGLS